MKKGVSERISVAGIVLMGYAAERFISDKAREARNRLLEVNRFRRTQGLRELKTITDEIVQGVLDESYKNT